MEELAVLDESSSKYYWHQQDDLLLGEELMMSDELLDETPPPTTVVYADSKQEEEDDQGPRRRRESMVNRLISTVYSGPTISDIESALSFTGGGDNHQLKYSSTSSSPVVFSPEKVLSKMENKYTLKIKACGNNGLAEDGYKWRKYGQKSIKNSPNPRSYYRCTNPRCNAKKQVERATDEPDTLLVTYEGLHLHYTYSHFLHAAQTQQQQGLPKKPKRGPSPLLELDVPAHYDEGAGGIAAGDAFPSVEAASAAAWGSYDGDEDKQLHMEEEDMANTNNGGLLEDVVPLLVRRPCSSSTTSSSNNSPPSPSTSSVSCWTPTSPYIDMAILSNIF